MDFSDSSPVTPAAHEAFVASRESFGHVWTLSKSADRSDKVATNSEAKYRETLGQDI